MTHPLCYVSIMHFPIIFASCVARASLPKFRYPVSREKNGAAQVPAPPAPSVS